MREKQNAWRKIKGDFTFSAGETRAEKGVSHANVLRAFICPAFLENVCMGS